MGAGSEIADLPRANVRRILKAKLVELATVNGEEEIGSRDLPIHKDALLAFCESAKIFIHYISSTANDICRESKRQTINADDVLKALEEIDFIEFTDPLKAALEGFRKENESKKAGKGGGRKRKVDEGLQADDNVKDGLSEVSEPKGDVQEVSDVDPVL